MKKIISVLAVILLLSVSLTGCMGSAPSMSDKGAVAHIEVKVDKELVSLSVDKDLKVLMASYGKYDDENKFTQADKATTVFKDIDVAGKKLAEAIDSITAIASFSSSTEILFEVNIKKSSLQVTDATKATIEKAVDSVKTTTAEGFKKVTNYKVTFGDEVLADSAKAENTSSNAN